MHETSVQREIHEYIWGIASAWRREFLGFRAQGKGVKGYVGVPLTKRMRSVSVARARAISCTYSVTRPPGPRSRSRSPRTRPVTNANAIIPHVFCLGYCYTAYPLPCPRSRRPSPRPSLLPPYCLGTADLRLALFHHRVPILLSHCLVHSFVVSLELYMKSEKKRFALFVLWWMRKLKGCYTVGAVQGATTRVGDRDHWNSRWKDDPFLLTYDLFW